MHMHPDKQANKSSENVTKGRNFDRETLFLSKEKRVTAGVRF
jgi:hypothetical protein